MDTKTEEFIPTRQSLLSRLRDWDDQASWKEFFDTYWKLIYGVARKAGLSDAEAQDVVQETIVSIAKKMPDFHYDPAAGSFKGWLMQLTRWRISDQFRKKQYKNGELRVAREEPLGTSILESHPDPAAFNLETAWEEEWERNLMELAIEKVKRRVNARQYQMFYLHVVKKLPTLEVARRLNVKMAEVYFAKYKVSALIKKEVKILQNRQI